MLNLFRLASNDQSLYYLGQIFGNVGVALSGTGPALLPTMFKVFNGSLLVVGTLIVVYTTIVGVLKTAAEGEALGKHWSSLWVPLRTLAGIAALFPTKTGYCAMQVIFMWVIVQGIGAADMVWKSAVEYFGVGGKVFNGALPAPQDVGGNAASTLNTLFQALVCQAVIVKSAANNANAFAHAPYTQNPNGTYTYNFGTANIPNECGSMNINGVPEKDQNGLPKKDEDGNVVIDKPVADTQFQAAQNFVPVYEILANFYTNRIINEPKCWNSKNTEGQPCHPTTVPGDSNVCLYFGKYLSFNSTTCPYTMNKMDANTSQTNLNRVVESILDSAGSNPMRDTATLLYGYAMNYTNQQKLKNPGGANIHDLALKRAETDGWILAGTYYYYIASIGGQNQGDYSVFLGGFNATLATNLQTIMTMNNRPEKEFGDFYSYYDFLTPTVYTAGQAALNLSARAASEERAGITKGGGLPSVSFVESVGIGAGLMVAFGWLAIPAMLAFMATANAMADGWIHAINAAANQDPIVAIHDFGSHLLLAADILFFVFFGIGIALGIASTVVVVLGITVNFLEGIAKFLQSFLLPLLFFFLAYLISIGGALGIYLPLIPYLYFAFGAIGWIIATVEAMTAAPIVALALLNPAAQHEMLGSAHHAFLLLANIFLRPTLMIFGLVSAILVGIVVVQFINAGFSAVIASMSSSLGYIELFLIIVAYTVLIITALTKVYNGMIVHLPEKAVGWAQIPGTNMGEEAAAGEIKGGISSGGQAASAGTKGALGASQKGAEAMQKKGEELKKQEGDDKAGLPGAGAGNIPGGGGGGQGPGGGGDQGPGGGSPQGQGGGGQQGSAPKPPGSPTPSAPDASGIIGGAPKPGGSSGKGSGGMGGGAAPPTGGAPPPIPPGS